MNLFSWIFLAVLVLFWVWSMQSGRISRIASPRYWLYCPFCPPYRQGGDRYCQPADCAHHHEGKWVWAWCSRCGACFRHGEWREPDRKGWSDYRNEAPPP